MKQPSDDTVAHGVSSRTGPLSRADSQLVITAEESMREALHPAIFNHTMRVLHLAWHLPPPHPAPEQEALAVAVLFHDAGTIGANNGEQRFEIEGADAAGRFLEDWGWTPDRIRPVWEAIALHTSPGIAERFGPLAQLVRTAVLIDLGRTELPVPSTAALEAQLDLYPRLDVARVLPATIVVQALEGGRTSKAPPFSWPGALVAEHLAGSHDADRSQNGTVG